MIRATLNKRKPDELGSGEFGASRGLRKHNGIDYTCEPRTRILSPVRGKVTKIGYPYADDFGYRYVQITDNDNRYHRVFYIEPGVSLGDVVTRDTIIGEAQDIAIRYASVGRMNNHVHYEIMTIKDGKKVYHDPEA